MPSLVTTLDRKLRASAFVRRNSGKVAAELPQNELAQFLHKSEEQMAEMEDVCFIHNITSSPQCLDSDMADRSGPKSNSDLQGLHH